MLLRNQRARGLDDKFIGPFEIVTTMDSSCLIRSLDTQKLKTVQYNHLKPYMPCHTGQNSTVLLRSVFIHINTKFVKL